MPLDVHAQECLSMFGYGTGYYADEASRGIYGWVGRGMCECCPLVLECRRLYTEKVEINYADAVSSFKNAKSIAERIGVSEDEITQGMARVGNTDPYSRVILENVQEGIEDREAVEESEE